MPRLNLRTPQAAIGAVLALIGLVLLASSPGGADGGVSRDDGFVSAFADGALAVEPAEVQFGKVAHADHPEAIVSVTNRSDEPVEILSVEAS